MYVIALLDSWELNLECMLEGRGAGGSVTCSLVFFHQCYVMVVHPLRFQVFELYAKLPVGSVRDTPLASCCLAVDDKDFLAHEVSSKIYGDKVISLSSTLVVLCVRLLQMVVYVDLVIVRVLCRCWLERRVEMLNNLFLVAFSCLHYEICGQ